jgi:hypothetical protein
VVADARIEAHQRMRRSEIAITSGRKRGASAWLATSRTAPRRRPCSSSISERTRSSSDGAAADVAHEQFARRCQAHAARQTLEERRAQFFLQVLDAAVDGGGRHVQPLGRLADRAGPGDLVGVAQEAKVVHAAALHEARQKHAAQTLPQRQRTARESVRIRSTFWHVGCVPVSA